jgi:hypothetical protein
LKFLNDASSGLHIEFRSALSVKISGTISSATHKTVSTVIAVRAVTVTHFIHTLLAAYTLAAIASRPTRNVQFFRLEKYIGTIIKEIPYIFRK